MGLKQAINSTAESIVAFILLVILAILSFFVIIFVVQTGAGMAGYNPSGNFVVLSSALMVAAAVLAGVLNT